MLLIPAKEVVAGDLILTHGKRNRTVIGRITVADDLLWFWSKNEQDADFLVGSYRPEEEVLVIRRVTSPRQTHEERTEELIGLTKAFLSCLEIDREDDGSTDFLISMAGIAHRLKEKLEEAYCSGDHPCFPSGNREPAS